MNLELNKSYTLAQRFPLIWKVSKTTVETALEIAENKGALAYFNNAFSYGTVATQLPRLKVESIAFSRQLGAKEELEHQIIEEFKQKGKEEGLVVIVAKHILPLIFMNIGGGAELESSIQEYFSDRAIKTPVEDARGR